jgi:hypothetical protein
MPKQIASATMEGTRKRGRPHTRRGEAEEDLKITGIKKQAGNGQTPSRMEEDCIGSQDPKQTVAPEEDEKENYGKVGKHERLSGIKLPWKTQNVEEIHILKYHIL